MTPLDIITDARDSLNNLSSQVNTDVKVRRALNRAIREWSLEVMPIQETFTVSLVANQDTYAWPDRIIEAYRTTINKGANTMEEDLFWIDFEDFDLRLTSSSSNGMLIAMIGSNAFRIWQKPSVSVTGGVKIYASAIPAPLATDGTDDATTLPFSTIHQEAFVAGTCFYLCQGNLEDPTAALRLPMFQQQWTEAKIDAIRHARRPFNELIQVGGGGVGRQPAPFANVWPANFSRSND